MAKTLCALKLSSGSQFYLIQNDQNNLVVSANYIGVPPVHNVLITDTGNKCTGNFGNMFLSGEIFNTENVYVLCNGERFKSLKDLLEKGLNIHPHQMPNLPVGHGPQMHNIVPVFNPQNQHNVANQPQYITDQHFRSNHDNRNTSYGKTKYNNPNQYNKYANRQLIRELVTSPDRHIAALQNGGYGNERY